MVVSEISHMLFALAWQVMNLEIPVGQYNISFLEIFIAVMVMAICMRLINRALEREVEE